MMGQSIAVPPIDLTIPGPPVSIEISSTPQPISKTKRMQKPKNPPNSFRLFLNHLRKQSADFPDPDFQGDIVKSAKKRWQSIAEEERKQFVEI
jgi:hypothetical protein